MTLHLTPVITRVAVAPRIHVTYDDPAARNAFRFDYVERYRDERRRVFVFVAERDGHQATLELFDRELLVVEAPWSFDRCWLALDRALRDLPCSLLDHSDDPAVQADERLIIADTERPGTWFGDDGADGRALTQEQTDTLIRSELWLTNAQSDELCGIIGAAVARRPWAPFGPSGINVDPRDVPTATRQRGGIDSDPLVRLLAWRAWGDRDRVWFEERGVRKGDAVLQIPNGRGGYAVARRWDSDTEWQPIGVRLACSSAFPGQSVECTVVGEVHGGGDRVWFQVSDRPREPPETVAWSVAGDGQIRIDGDLDLDSSGDLLPAERRWYSEYNQRPVPLADHREPPPMTVDVARWIRAHSKAIQRSLPRHPDLVSPAAYELLVRAEIRRALERGDSRRRVVRDIAQRSTLTHDEVVALVDRELAADPMVSPVQASEAAKDALEITEARRSIASGAPTPPVPPWARLRRCR